MTDRAHALYICYFGLREPLVQSQVLPYLRELAAGGFGMSLLTFEREPRNRWSGVSMEEWRTRLRGEGIEWHALRYHKRPSLPATVYDILRGSWRAAAIARRERIEIFHGRSHVGAAIGAIAKQLTRAKLIFDFRGFMAEEYVDSGNWRAGGLLFRLTKAAERWLFRVADGFVILTEAARDTCFPDGTGGRPLELVPCCVDVERFAGACAGDRNAMREKLGIAGRTVVVYSGAIGGYYLAGEMVEMLDVARTLDPDVYALVLTHSPVATVTEALERRGFREKDYRVLSVAPEEMPRYLRTADVALSIIAPSFARRAASPTKFAEYLAAGLPVIVSPGIGDLDAQIERARVGVSLRRLDREAYAEAFRRIVELREDPELEARCRDEARIRYDLHNVGGVRYGRLYAAVAGQ